MMWGFRIKELLGISEDPIYEGNTLPDIPMEGSLFLVDDIQKIIVFRDSAFGIYWNYPPVCRVWTFKQMKKILGRAENLDEQRRFYSPTYPQ